MTCPMTWTLVIWLFSAKHQDRKIVARMDTIQGFTSLDDCIDAGYDLTERLQKGPAQLNKMAVDTSCIRQ